MPSRHVLVVEDDSTAAEFLVDLLGYEGFLAQSAGSVAEAISALGDPAERFDAIILDLGLPDGDGREVFEWMKAAQIRRPVLVLTGSEDEEDLLSGLAAGATDFVTKPCPPAIILARLRAMLRSIQGSDDDSIPVGPWAFQAAERTLLDREQGVRVRLTVRETAILKMLHGRRGGIVRRTELLSEVWGYKPGVRTHTVESHVYRLRKKIELDPENSPLLITVEGGYRLAPDQRPVQVGLAA